VPVLDEKASATADLVKGISIKIIRQRYPRVIGEGSIQVEKLQRIK
jgi:hypothetical protein